MSKKEDGRIRLLYAFLANGLRAPFDEAQDDILRALV